MWGSSKLNKLLNVKIGYFPESLKIAYSVSIFKEGNGTAIDKRFGTVPF